MDLNQNLRTVHYRMSAEKLQAVFNSDPQYVTTSSRATTLCSDLTIKLTLLCMCV